AIPISIPVLSRDDSFYRIVNPLPFVPSSDSMMTETCEEIINIQVAGLAKRLDFIRCRTLVVGISGGLDSTLALLVAVRTFDRLGIDRKGIIGITMPGFGTTDRTRDNAMALMTELGISIRTVPIADAVNRHFSDIGHDPEVHDVTYENSQARERTQILMDVANELGGIVLGTGDLSELALGWATYNGDHMSMYGVNASVPKTLVKYLVRHFAMSDDNHQIRRILLDIVDTPISPELIPADANGDITQKTEDLVGPYELHDFFLFYTLRYGFSPERILFLARKAFDGKFEDAVIEKWLRTFVRRFFAQQCKRSCLPDGPKVGSVCLSPRGDWRMPSDAVAFRF
ncbi:MAG: NAD(+) synthase, partial [Muribaculaceae bacterium]|nr:NAD(+) synthase [Muribaculaceae bacterium]